MNYESSFASLPMGLVVTPSIDGRNRYFGMTWITRILPYIEQAGMWNDTLDDYRFVPNPFRSNRTPAPLLDRALPKG